MSDEQEQTKGEKLLQKRVEQEQLREFRRVRASALTMAEYTHGQDKEILTIKKKMMDAESEVKKISLDLSAAKKAMVDAKNELEQALEAHIPAELRILEKIKTDPDANCLPCQEKKAKQEAEKEAAAAVAEKEEGEG